MSNDNEIQSSPCREKLWTERDVEQKLEALRQHIIYLTDNAQSSRGVLNGLIRHEHSADGRLLVPLNDNNNGPYRRDRVPTALRDKE